MAKGIAAQKAEQEAKRLAEQLEAQREQEELEQDRLRSLEVIRQAQEEEWREKLQLRDVLHHQMQAVHQRKQILYQEFLAEKMFLDEVCRKLQEERFQEIQRKLELQERTRQEMEYFREAKEIWQERQKLALAEENERIRRYLEARDQQQQADQRRKLESARSREQLNEKMVTQLQAEFVSVLFAVLNFDFLINSALTEAGYACRSESLYSKEFMNDLGRLKIMEEHTA